MSFLQIQAKTQSHQSRLNSCFYILVSITIIKIGKFKLPKFFIIFPIPSFYFSFHLIFFENITNLQYSNSQQVTPFSIWVSKINKNTNFAVNKQNFSHDSKLTASALNFKISFNFELQKPRNKNASKNQDISTDLGSLKMAKPQLALHLELRMRYKLRDKHQFCDMGLIGIKILTWQN